MKAHGFEAFIKISIHAPREGGDRDFKSMDKRVVISIHAPREGGDFKSRFTLLVY